MQTTEEINEVKDYLMKDGNPIALHVQINGERRRLFANRVTGQIGIFPKRGRSKGYVFYDWCHVEKVFYPKKKEGNEKVDINAKLVKKYQRMAAKATFRNGWIETIMEADPRKSLYENQITSGNSIDGKVVSLKCVERYCGKEEMDMFREAVRKREEYEGMRFDFGGYDGKLWGVRAGFDKEYRGCLNGYYYALVNDDNFIGCDVD